MTPFVGVALVVACLVTQAFFAASETALVTANRASLKTRADGGDKGATAALELLHREDRLLGTTLVGANLSMISATTLAAGLLIRAGVSSEIVVTALFVPVVLVFGETLPKTLASHHADALAPILARPLILLQLLFGPALFVIGAWSRVLHRLLGVQDARIARQDLVEMIDDAALRDIHPAERRIIQRVLDMPGTTVSDCMTALVEVAAVSESASLTEAADVVLRSGHSRIPVYRDRVDNIVGVLHHRALLSTSGEGRVADVMVLPLFVPETKGVDELMRKMLHDQDRFAVVVDEYGGSIGVVTLEDLVEEIVGSIQDERDSEPQVRRLGDTEWRVPGKVRIEELEAATGVALPEGEYSTVAGLILSKTGRIPIQGESVRVGSLNLVVEAATDRAVVAVRVTKVA